MADPDWLLAADWFAGRPLTRGALRLYRHFGQERGTRHLALRILEVGGDPCPTWRHDGAHELLYVTLGRGTIAVGGHPCPVAPGTALHVAPGSAVRPRARGTLRMVSVLTPDPGPDPGFEADEVAEPGPIPATAVFAPGDVAGGAAERALLEIPPARMVIHTLLPGRAEISPGTETGVVVLGGQGRLTVGAHTAPLVTGACVALRASGAAVAENTGAAMLHLLCISCRAG